MKIESNIIFNSCLADVQNRDSIQSLELHDNVQKCAKPDRPAHQTSPPPETNAFDVYQPLINIACSW